MSNKKSVSMFFSSLVLVCSTGMGGVGTSIADTVTAMDMSDQVIHASRNTNVVVPIYKSRVIVVPAPVKRVSIGNPDVADVLVLGSDDLYVLGKDLGTTNVLLWDRNDVLISSLQLSVTHDLNQLKQQIHTVLPTEPIEVASVQRNLVLSGQVSSAIRMDAALKIAEGFLEQAATAKETIMFQQQKTSGGTGNAEKKSGQVINLMTVGGGSQQVMLEVRVAEVNRDAAKNMNAQMNALGVNGRWSIGGVNGGATFPDAIYTNDNLRIPIFGNQKLTGLPVQNDAVYDEFAAKTPSITSTGIFASFLGNGLLANLVLDAYQQKGLAKILAEPTLTTLSGQDAQFLSGGSFPIPVSQENGKIGIEFKDYGVKLQFQPFVLDNGHINLKLNISVSELADSSALTIAAGSTASFTIPSLSERRAVSTVELADGQSISIAGLMSETTRTAINKFPGLGNIPILGALFRSQSFQKGQTELVILVTPRLAKPIKASDVKLPTDSYTDPSDMQFFLGGKIEGSAPDKQVQKKSDAK